MSTKKQKAELLGAMDVLEKEKGIKKRRHCQCFNGCFSECLPKELRKLVAKARLAVKI